MRLLTALLLFFSLSACGGDPFWLPRAHKISIQQGNLLNQAMVERISIGMNRETVRGLIGLPVLNNTFRDNRWDYLYTKGPAGSAINARRLTITFADDQVVSIEDNHQIESGERPAQRYFWEKRSDDGTDRD